MMHANAYVEVFLPNMASIGREAAEHFLRRAPNDGVIGRQRVSFSNKSKVRDEPSSPQDGSPM